MQTVAAGGHGGGEQRRGIQVTVRCFGRADAHGLGGQLDMKGVGVGLRISSHRFNAQLPAGPQNPEGDFSPVGNQNPLQHGL